MSVSDSPIMGWLGVVLSNISYSQVICQPVGNLSSALKSQKAEIIKATDGHQFDININSY